MLLEVTKYVRAPDGETFGDELRDGFATATSIIAYRLKRHRQNSQRLKPTVFLILSARLRSQRALRLRWLNAQVVP